MPNSSVNFQVPGLSQPNSNLCWWTSFKMLTLYHRNRGVGMARIRNIESHTEAMQKFNNNETASTEEIEQIARDLGFSIMASTLVGSGLLAHMDRHGPQMYSGYWPSGGGHCVVFTGTDGNRIGINDPWDGAVSANYNGYVGSYLIIDTALVYFNNGNR
jgi:ABC-type bacteriocin/lantibiotic exporter with double-glycine peptidase domain